MPSFRPPSKHAARRRRSPLAIPGAVLGLLLGLVAVHGQALAHDGLDHGYEGASYNGPGSDPSEPSGTKPESKLWFHDGAWWGVLWSWTSASNSQGYYIHRLEGTSWARTGVKLDSRPATVVDVLADGQTLYVASHRTSGDAACAATSACAGPGYESYLFRLSYSAGAGYAVTATTTINSTRSETLVIDKDTAGRVWATWTQADYDGACGCYRTWVYVNRTATDGVTWGTPFRLPGASNVHSDDVSALVAFNGQIGVMWSDQVARRMNFATHRDGDADGAWSTIENAVAGLSGNNADDHVSLRTDSARTTVYAVTKTSQGSTGRPLILLLVRPAAGTWTAHTVSVVNEGGIPGNSLTRPVAVVDEAAGRLHVYAMGPQSPGESVGYGGAIYRKSSSLAAIGFAPGLGDVVMQDAVSTNTTTTTDSRYCSYVDAKGVRHERGCINDPTTTKQPLTSAAGGSKVVVLASNQKTQRYWHSDDSASAAPTPTPSPSPTPSSSPSPSASAAPTPTPSPTPAPTPGEGIALRSASYAANESTNSLRIPAPTGALAGDVLLASIDVRGSRTVATPPGWTLIRTDANGTSMRKATFYRVATGSEPTDYVWTFSGSAAASGGIHAYAGVDTTTPVDAHGGQLSSNTTLITAPSLVPTLENSVLVGLYGMAVTTTIAPPSGFTERGEASGVVGQYTITTEGADRPLTDTRATGPHAAVAMQKWPSVGQAVILRPRATWTAEPAQASSSPGDSTGSSEVASALYVSTAGSDSYPGTYDQPLRTVAQGLALVAPGQTLYLRGGTYIEDISVDLSRGRADAPILVSAYPGERPVIQGLVSIRQPHFVTLDGFNVTWNSAAYDQHMLKISGGTNWVLQNSEVWGARSFANLLISGAPHNWVVRGNVIHDTFGGEEDLFRSHNIYVNTGLVATGGLIERNLIYNADHGSNLKLGGTGGSGEGAANVVVRYNTLHNATQPLVIGDGSHNITIERNIIGGGMRGHLVRLFDLTGANIAVRSNLGFGADVFCMDYESPTACGSVVTETTFPLDPKYASEFVPTDPVAIGFGRYAP